MLDRWAVDRSAPEDARDPWDPPCKEERLLEVMRRAHVAGQLDFLEYLLGRPQARWMSREGSPRQMSAIERWTALLARDRVEEERRGGRGSLIDPANPLSLMLEEVGGDRQK